MKLRIAVDQRQAIRLGFNANSTVLIDLDVSQLHQTVRDFIADRFLEGMLLADPKDKKSKLTISRPDLQGLMEAIEAAMKADGKWVRWESVCGE